MMRIYVDTSVFGGCHDPEFKESSRSLVKEFRNGLKVAVISDLTLKELEKAPLDIRTLVEEMPKRYIEYVTLDNEAVDLAFKYIKEGAVTETYLVDAQHIAMATIKRVDVLVSWNFKHIVNLTRIRLYNSVNLKNGYPLLEIRSPQEVLYEK
jgi:hypothetical protein